MAKRRANGDGLMRKRSDGRWEGRIIVGHKDDGSPIFEFVFAKSQKAMIQKVHQLMDEMEQLIQAINTKGVAVYDENGNKVQLLKWKNLNLIGETAREKAKRRQENPKK